MSRFTAKNVRLSSYQWHWRQKVRWKMMLMLTMWRHSLEILVTLTSLWMCCYSIFIHPRCRIRLVSTSENRGKLCPVWKKKFHVQPEWNFSWGYLLSSPKGYLTIKMTNSKGIWFLGKINLVLWSLVWKCCTKTNEEVYPEDIWVTVITETYIKVKVINVTSQIVLVTDASINVFPPENGGGGIPWGFGMRLPEHGGAGWWRGYPEG